ncbi:hypothetical protein PHYSODRAFT_532312 [Phytophthora sojae]|uniref:Uncharacterized protein n=1 Tax=Phytophthora sojae (strain P6497) TaxID=1094619 RepID=G5AEF6_PHYSP|nr:hypothetical protein PHYSODRAFT_532312 [Phytophthora sojae]EGZ06558.1 hypothetical protein PHYSODRAFT_532312 [Phytophthora sojae]|eukprot:XP_009538455.1 hypothetical protein PHYSODRAFT_532312 [Phytophthora sojae]
MLNTVATIRATRTHHFNALKEDGELNSVPNEREAVCEYCAAAKQSRKPFSSTKDEMEAMENARNDTSVCSDVLGAITPVSKSGYKYIVIFILMQSRYLAIYPMRNNSEVCGVSRETLKKVQREAGLSDKVGLEFSLLY